MRIDSIYQYRYAPLFFTGHSLGGALAQLAAYDISINFDLPDPVQVSQREGLANRFIGLLIGL